MGFWSGFKKVTKPFVDVPSWLNTREIKTYGNSIIDMGKGLFIPQTPKHNESFEQAKIRLRLTEKDIQKRRNEFRTLVILFSLITLFLVGYLIYLIVIHSSILAKLITMALILMVLAKLFNYHFWLYQIQKRRLGCSIKEWFREGLLGMKK